LVPFLLSKTYYKITCIWYIWLIISKQQMSFEKATSYLNLKTA
jgi:hypothetical protein